MATNIAGCDVRAFGATGDGRTLDTPAINRAIEAAADAGGGTVHFPAGNYLCFSIRLKSRVTLYLGPGATIIAAKPKEGFGAYDLPEPNASDKFQDFGHSHWQNSLIWGIGLEDIGIEGSGRINGQWLTRSGPRSLNFEGDVPPGLTDHAPKQAKKSVPQLLTLPSMIGQGNKAIGLKQCRGVLLRNFTILRGGHFAILATGVDQLSIDNLRIDTNRDGIDIDCCRNVRVSNCAVNSLNDDAICLKSSYALGAARVTENVTIANCSVSGFDVGTMLDGTYQRTQKLAPDRDGPTGRIKLGTESNGGFKNIAISNCTFERSRGLAIEAVDGGKIEDVSITNLTMREINNSLIFIRLGNRARGPENSPVSSIRRVNISNIAASDVDGRYASIISGIPGHPIQGVTISNVQVLHTGGGTKEDAAIAPPEKEKAYTDPSMFGTAPASALYARHVEDLGVHHWQVSFAQPEMRPAVVLHDVNGASFDHLKTPRIASVPLFSLQEVKDFAADHCAGAADVKRDSVDQETF
jgi:polygalacturonase